MLPRAVRLVAVEVSGAGRLSPAELLAAGEQTLNLALRGGAGRVYMFYGVSRGDALVLGLYDRLPAESGLAGVYRRVTGGRPILLGEGEGYAAVVAPVSSLAEAARLASKLGECVSARGWGVTRFEGWAFIELLAGLNPYECLQHLYSFEGVSRISIPSTGLERLASAYRSPSWRFYSPPEPGASVVVEERFRGEYHVGVAVEVFEEYVADSWIYGVFHAAPPMEPFNIIATLKGTRLDEMVLANLEVALKHRVELYGVEADDIWQLLQKLSLKLQS